MTDTDNARPDDDIDTELGERYYRNDKGLEARLTGDIVEVIRQFIEKRFQEGRRPAMRDAHAQDTGCVRAIFRVDPDLAPALRHGVFGQPGKEYDAWIRFSNGNSEVLSSRVPDARGMAIKLMGVTGPKLLEDEIETQDFVMANNPVFFVDDLQRYKDSLVAFHRGGYLRQFAAIFKLKLREARTVFKVNATFATNPLYCRYWSMTPYRLGARRNAMTAIKFSVTPRVEADRGWVSSLGTFFSPGFSLKKELEKALAGKEMRFDFYVQRFVDDRTPIEDTITEWKESVSKPEHVAEIVIPSQEVDTPARNSFGENLSFNPWHSVAEHKPLGTVNRVRKAIYLEISKYRHQLNRAPLREPKPEDVA